MKSARTIANAGRLGFFLVALPLLLAVGPKSCLIDVECGDVLDIDYGQYRLSGDLECPWNSSLRAVTITGEGVHFNLRGYTISDTRGFLQRGISVEGANAHIHNGSIVDFDCVRRHHSERELCAAIVLHEAPGARINGMSLHNNTVGIVSFTSSNADGARINGNDITGNLRIGIGLFGSAEGANITGNDLSDTGGFSEDSGWGYVGLSDGVSLIGNVASNNAGAGILLYGSEDFPPAGWWPERNTIRDNTALDNGRAGIGLVGDTEATRPRDNLIQDNTAFGNCLEPVCSHDLAESVVEEGPQADCLNTWQDNDFDVAEPDCIE